MRKYILGINVFFLILLLSGNVYAQVKQLRSQESIEMIIRADMRDYKRFEELQKFLGTPPPFDKGLREIIDFLLLPPSFRSHLE